jgi:hypothetical protein
MRRGLGITGHVAAHLRQLLLDPIKAPHYFVQAAVHAGEMAVNAAEIAVDEFFQAFDFVVGPGFSRDWT